MTTMLETMARATYAKWIEDVRDLEPSWDDLPDSHRDRLIDASRAALQSIREPSEAARVAAAEAGDDYYLGDKITWEEIPVMFTAMIDAILEGKA
jgi:hypothetical protein